MRLAGGPSSPRRLDYRAFGGRPRSKLNDRIRVTTLLLNFMFSILSVGTITACVFILISSVGELLPGSLVVALQVLLALSALALFVALAGCIGTVHQTERTGCLQGRRIMMVYWLVLCGFLIGAVTAILRLRLLTESISFTLDNLETLDLDEFERGVADEFNPRYFRATCREGSADGVWRVVNEYCPDSMRENTCAIGGSDCSTCLPECGTYSTTSCPSEAACPRNDDKDLEGCPYVACREGLLHFFSDNLVPVEVYFFFYGSLMVLLSVFACLVICYNPRLSQEQKLRKTGMASIAKERRERGMSSRTGTATRGGIGPS